MMRTGAEHLESIRDGRVVYIGSERVEDVTTHPAFRGAAHTVASLFDLKAANPDLSFEEGGERFGFYYLKPRSRDDLRFRMNGHRRFAEATLGMFGRSPDHVASFVTGMTAMPEMFEANRKGFGANIQGYYDYLRKKDLYATYAVLPPQGMRNPDLYIQQNRPVPSLRVLRETDGGVVIGGMKMLATGAAVANEMWIGNIQPLAPGNTAEAITCAIPIDAPGLSLWSRRPITVRDASDGPLTWRYEETDAMVLCDEVKVPWERVFIHEDTALSRDIYYKTPAHSFSNHQSCVRTWVKIGFLVGLASRVTQATGADKIPAVLDTLGRLASLEATIGHVVMGQIEAAESWSSGFMGCSRRGVYAAINWMYENYSPIVDTVRELCGGGAFQMPADVSILDDPKMKETFETYWHSPQLDALSRMELFRLAWDITSSDFAGRHLQYERAYLGAHFVVRHHGYREAPWEKFHAMVDDVLAEARED